MSGPVHLIARREGLRAACRAARAEGRLVGLVPTMGALHAGHRSLLGRARDECGFVAMSIFVNPLQFDDAADLAAYPRGLPDDLAVAEQEGCDAVFAPDRGEMYPGGGPDVTVDPGALGDRYEGAARSGHFRGVLTVVAKLLHLAGPCRAYFGEKDAQQVELVRRMVRDLDLPVEVVRVATVREPDGLAVSSRNGRLTAEERTAARALPEGLRDAAGLLAGGVRDAQALGAAVLRRVSGAGALVRPDYAAIVDERTWDEVASVERPARALVAARFTTSATRLIDNVALVPPDARGARAQ